MENNAKTHAARYFPLPEPSPVPGCTACLSFATARRNARSVHDHSAVTDANVLLRRHLSEAH
ncbi:MULTISPECIES: hypothetical protein [unclassified Streptomyces]|uniref:Uncharacterized protein n=1 Tax=Streptomyces niveiscabiei TaxID=164115 RepID=A0ABW9HHT9_9ACTN|nr:MULTISPECIES: hypothetical protein [unclassified Streptomyces]QZZ28198.1 hypothetical protein A7X85_19710 [Streptomyces sp. ST1015]